MKLINQSYEICKTHGYTLQDIYKDIERAFITGLFLIAVNFFAGLFIEKNKIYK